MKQQKFSKGSWIIRRGHISPVYRIEDVVLTHQSSFTEHQDSRCRVKLSVHTCTPPLLICEWYSVKLLMHLGYEQIKWGTSKSSEHSNTGTQEKT